ncbi:hypothetical protein RND71_044039 [Anisodus tanguticus]|uniref:Superoxide dismutase copper/zinc binding domain-containing protein n=1 Tax=Anisodus tanguticus TaxID=243964 RepID=A0AAE1UM27_9SOLA|nr:hypothetical protein RND71_044039 [Anisodus tanguticus]
MKFDFNSNAIVFNQRLAFKHNPQLPIEDYLIDSYDYFKKILGFGTKYQELTTVAPTESFNDVTTASNNVTTTPSNDMKTTPSSDTKTTPSSDIKTTPSSDIKTTPSSDIKTTPSSDIKTTSSSDMKTTTSSGIKTTPSSGMKTTPSSGMKTKPSYGYKTTPSNVQGTRPSNNFETTSTFAKTTPSSKFKKKSSETPKISIVKREVNENENFKNNETFTTVSYDQQTDTNKFSSLENIFNNTKDDENDDIVETTTSMINERVSTINSESTKPNITKQSSNKQRDLKSILTSRNRFAKSNYFDDSEIEEKEPHEEWAMWLDQILPAAKDYTNYLSNYFVLIFSGEYTAKKGDKYFHRSLKGGGCHETKGDFNPYSVNHGGPDYKTRHLGDLGNIEANSTGIAVFRFKDKQIKVHDKLRGIIGRSVVIHEFEDDFGQSKEKQSTRSGDSGGTPEIVLWWDTDNKIYGRTNNPYDLSRIPGGSSGGEGALIAAAGSIMGVGSDILGSIRIPSMFNELPATHCATGLSKEGLPTGFTVATGISQDRLSIAFAKEIEKIYNDEAKYDLGVKVKAQGLLLGVKQGFNDLFYEPAMGIVQGPEEFAEGLVLGVRSLFSSTVGGVAGAMGKITGTLGEGISSLMDQAERKKRRERLNKPTTILQNSKNLAKGFFSGVTGLVSKPIEGVKKDGFEGLVKGVGHGVIGLVAQPTTGIIDFTSGTLNQLQRTVNIAEEVKRQRPTRAISVDGVLRSYNAFEAIGKEILKSLSKGNFSTDQPKKVLGMFGEKFTYEVVCDNKSIVKMLEMIKIIIVGYVIKKNVILIVKYVLAHIT